MRLDTVFQQYIHLSKYSKWIDDAGRRETSTETVDRYLGFFYGYLKNKFGDMSPTKKEMEYYRQKILNLEVLPSMRAMATAGPALARDEVCCYNCSYLPVDSIESFSEILFILACTAGVGFSVERQYINKLPPVPSNLTESDTIILVPDSKQGWASSLHELITLLYSGRIPKWDVSKVRPAGSRLKVMGGRASGPEPLVNLFNFVIETFKGAKGRKLNSIECHDIVCLIGELIVCGGVRRSALISLSNLSDQRMRDAKSGSWYNIAPGRQMANNSVAYTERPEVGIWMKEWSSIYDSKSGERGIFNREAAIKKIQGLPNRHHLNENGDVFEYGTNPCGEIILRPYQFCNLSSAICRDYDTPESLEAKVRAAATFGTWQSTMVNFRYLRDVWSKNCSEERLLGVSLNGIMDCPLLNGTRPKNETVDLLEYLRECAREENSKWASRFGIPKSAAITCVKPEGNSSQMVNSASGLHPRFSKRYIRRVRQDVVDPLTRFMIDAGFPHEVDKMSNGHRVVFEFPVTAPENSITIDDMSAMDQLEHWMMYRKHWCDHNPSITVHISEDEWPEVGAWVWKNFDDVGGVAFLPKDGHVYVQAPYESVGKETLERLESRMPKHVDWSNLSLYEKSDGSDVTSARELACMGGTCEI